MDKPWKVHCLAWKVHCLAWKVHCLAWNLHLPKISKNRIFSFIFLDARISANECELMRNKISGKKLGNTAF